MLRTDQSARVIRWPREVPALTRLELFGLGCHVLALASALHFHAVWHHPAVALTIVLLEVPLTATVATAALYSLRRHR